ncbi:flavodoxin domain-containing protein [Cellulomonas sp.]|uniref:flavodoxin domain-containing protein n=1 Tax=Cellulomonas sp. TaxID=40001 RepID=UPI00258858BB|nr:flavodoxin domain-containing protein [Cellulomonas sp.]MCR6690577.1 flavodoxin domain-containing protein [Cellulomonas sp.]
MRVLVAVASRHGGTWGIGERIAAELSGRGCHVDLLPADEVTDAAGYDALVLGSAVYTGHWISSARELGHRIAADAVPPAVWLFSSGLATQPAAAANSPHEIAALAQALHARGHRSFRGRLDVAALSFAERAIIAGARARAGDHRNFEVVAQWAQGIADALMLQPAH